MANDVEIKVGGTYNLGGQSRFPHRVLAITEHPSVPGDKRVFTRVLRPDGSLGSNENKWSLAVLASRVVEEVAIDQRCDGCKPAEIRGC